jgi:3-dehydroquinate dehydratase/shikimate dehydrogenase
LNGRVTLIGSLTEDPDKVDLEGLSEKIDILEIRADLLGEVDFEEIRRRFGGRLLFTLRSRREGGRGPDPGHDREDRVLAASDACDLVDLEARHDLYPEILDRIPAERRIISWHGTGTDLDALEHRITEMSREPAFLYKLVSAASAAQRALLPLTVLHQIDRRDVVAFASGGIGSWTRLIAPRLGAPVVYAAIGSVPAAEGQMRVERLREDFGLPTMEPVRRLFGIVGNPVRHSLSPRLHNRLYRALGLEHLYLPFEVPIFGDFWLDIVESGALEDLGMPLGGLSVTAPFKEIALAVAGAASPLAERIGSANTLVMQGEVWEAESTDPDSVRRALRARNLDVRGRRAAVIGAGGAGRSAVFGLGIEGAAVTLVNRSPERGRRVARELGVSFVPLEDFEPGGFDVVANATPVGASDKAALPFDVSSLNGDGVVFDLAYDPERPTRLVEEALRLGLTVIDGREALLHQAVSQFRLMNGVSMPLDLARRALGLPPESDAR